MGLNGLLLGQSVVQTGRLRGQRLRAEDEEERRRLEAEDARQAAAEAWRMALQERQAQFQRDQLRQQAELAAQNRVHQSALQMQRLGEQGAQAEANRKNKLDVVGARRPVVGAGRGTEPYDDRRRLQLANTDALVGAMNGLEQQERRDPASASRPWAGAVGRAAAGVLRHVDEDLAAGVENVGLSNEQTDYQGLAEQWAHNYIPNLPGFRMSVPMFKSVKKAFFPPLGESDPAVIASFTRRRRIVTEGLVQARQSGVSEAELAQRVAQQLREFGAPEAAEELTRHSGLVPEASASPDGTYTNRRSPNPARQQVPAPTDSTPSRNYSRFRTGGN